MKLFQLRDALRDRLLELIDEGLLTGSELARGSGVANAHISNFLNQKRGLSLEMMDVLLELTGMEAEDLIAPEVLQSGLPFVAESPKAFVAVPIVSPRNALTPAITRARVLSVLHLPSEILPKTEKGKRRNGWHRFIGVEGSKGEFLIIDRKCCTPREGRFAIQRDGSVDCGRFVEIASQEMFFPEDLTHKPQRSCRVIGRIVQVQKTIL